MRVWVLALLAACGGGDWLTGERIIVDSAATMTADCRAEICPHNENVDLTVFDGAIYLVHRTALSQILGPNSSLRISRSDDGGASWTLLAVLPAIDGRDLAIIEHGEVPSAGDTAYAGIAPLSGSRYLVSWYSSPLAGDPSWAAGIFGPTDIWQATLDLSAL